MFNQNNENKDFSTPSTGIPYGTPTTPDTAPQNTDAGINNAPVSAPVSGNTSPYQPTNTGYSVPNPEGYNFTPKTENVQTPPPPYSPFTPPAARQGAPETNTSSTSYTAPDSFAHISNDIPHTPTGYTPPTSATPPTAWNKVNYTPTSPVADYRPASRGLKIFAIIMVAIIALSATCVSGYFLGRSSIKSVGKDSVSVDLAAKPKDTDQMTPAQVYEQVNKSIVGIRVYNSQGNMSDASGVIYSKEGYIVTNDHIYSEVGAPKFKIYMHDGTERSATYVAGDTISDLAVLKLDNASDIKPAVLGDSGELFCGENVVAVGRPSDATASSSITSGIVSVTSRRVQTTSSYSARLIQTDSAINPGSSGGALVNMYGQVVGITASKLAGVEYDAVGFAIPTKTVKRVVEQLITDKKVTDRAKLGITYTELNSVSAEISDRDSIGLYVATVSEDSDLYGKVGEGDIITHINGTEISNDDIVLDIIEDCVAGDSITLTVVNTRGNTTDYTVVLKANVGESSYSDVMSPDSSSGNSSGSSGGGTFDFPFGE